MKDTEKPSHSIITATRLLKLTEITETVFEEPDGPSIKCRKARKARVLSREEQAQGFNNRVLDPALFSSNQAQSGAPYHQHFQQGNGGVTQSHGLYAAAAEALSHPPYPSTTPGPHATSIYFNDQVSAVMNTGNVNDAAVSQIVENARGFRDVPQDFGQITAYVGSGIDSHHVGPA
ncbi:hypothetical protein CBER1_05033 [Cercospora berteroae]|uniref:Uncharacterized protein n=1 Tax=Cercospora berteroae TaxID=357750 RepID=A0A2S6BRF7_9PEZI|nr:hypothetical protein CBER1_05033 [Cercospora berteroae]